MKKKVLVISAIAAAVLLLTAVAVLVLPLLNSDSPLDGNLKLEKGVLSWDVITDAAGYEVDLGSGGVLVSLNHYDLSANCAYSGEVSITVRAVHRNNGRKDIGNMKVTVNRVAQPIISIEEGETPCFVWSAVENATGYTYDAYDGNGTLTATADEDGRYRVQITDMDEQMIRVTALGGSVDGVVYAANDCLYRYSSSRVFDLSLIAEHPAVYYATGTLGVQEVIKVGTNLPKGTYPMTVTLYASTVSGDKLKGNGTWGRRIVDNGKPRVHLWMCEEAPSADWPDAAGTIPYPDEVVTVDLLVQVDLSSNALILCHDFDQGDMVVIKDLVMDGKSVLNDRKGEPNPEIVIDPFDLSTLDNYLASFRGTGEFLARDKSNIENFILRVPTNLEDGYHCVKINYYVCGPEGKMLTGNGTWGRRVSTAGTKTENMCWIIENDVDQYKATDIPFPTSRRSHIFDVEVNNGYIELECYDFNKDEYFIVESVTLAPPIEGGFDLTTLDNYLASFRGTGEFLARDKSNIENFILRVPTELEDGEHTVRVNYYLCGSRGEKLTGNGTWGRRVLCDGAKDADMLWLNETRINDYMPVVLPEPTQLSSFMFDVEVKDGYFELLCYDFDKGDYLIVESVEQASVPEGGFDLTTIDNYLAYYRGTGEWLARDKSNIQDFIIKIPTELENGQHNVRVNYYVCGSRGEKLTGNGMWCRRVLRDGARDAEMLWLNENQVNDYMPVVLPEPTQLSSFAFDVEVKDGYFELLCFDFDKGDYFIVESAESTAKAMSVDNLTFIDTSNGFVFEAQTTADLKALYEAGTELQMTVKYQFSETSAEDAANAQLSTVTIPVTVDENGRICLHPEQEEAGLKLIIPAGAVIAAKDNPNLEIEIKKEVVLERDASNWGTKDGWAQSVYTDVTLTFQNASNGYIFAAETSVDLPKTYGTWKQLNLTVQIQRGNDAADLENAELEEIQAYFCVDEKGRMLLYGAQEYRSAKLIIPAGTIITPSDQALSKDKLRIANEIILGRNASNWGTADGWQELVYHDVKLTFADTSNGFVFEGETAADLKALYEAGANFTVDAKFQYSQLPDEPTVQAEPVDATVSVTLDENGRICLHPEQEEMGVQLVIPKGTVITPADLSLCNVHLELADDVVLERDVSEVGTKDGWKQIEIVDVNLSFRDASNGYIFDTTFVDDEKKFNLIEAYGTWANNKLELTVKSQYGANASDAESATLKEITAYFNVDDDGRLRMYGAKEYAGIKLEIPAGTIVTPTNAEKSDVRLRIAEDIVLERTSSNFGTADGWQVAADPTPEPEPEAYTDVKLTYVDNSNGFTFKADNTGSISGYADWKKLNLTVQAQYGDSAEAADAAQLTECSAYLNKDGDVLHLYIPIPDTNKLYNNKAIRIVIPAGTIVTPADDAGNTAILRITNDIILARDSSNWGTANGWQMVEAQEPEPENYIDVKLTFKDASNGLVFNVECEENLKTTYGTWKNLDVTVQRKFSKSSVQEALDAQLENVNAWFCVDDKGYLCLYGAGDVGSVKIIIPAGTIITPSDKALSDVSIRITNDIVLERDAVYWMTSDGWVQQDTEL